VVQRTHVRCASPPAADLRLSVGTASRSTTAHYRTPPCSRTHTRKPLTPSSHSPLSALAPALRSTTEARVAAALRPTAIAAHRTKNAK
jgi:transposase-like protein